MELPKMISRFLKFPKNGLTMEKIYKSMIMDLRIENPFPIDKEKD
jgi:hypothetical protein